MSSHACAFCGRDAGGDRGYITVRPREMTVMEQIAAVTEEVRPETPAPSDDIRTCLRDACLYAARMGYAGNRR